MSAYSTEKQILDVIKAFETATIAREKWRHAEHLIVANYYLTNSESLSDAYHKMRGGIFNLLESFGVDLSKEMPYHETLTMFWMKTVDDFRKTKNGYSMLDICIELTETFDKDYPLRFYSRDLLFSDEARARFVEADIAPLILRNGNES
jgi:hypothetical protein